MEIHIQRRIMSLVRRYIRTPEKVSTRRTRNIRIRIRKRYNYCPISLMSSIRNTEVAVAAVEAVIAVVAIDLTLYSHSTKLPF
jgi:hypothetical protein